MKDNNCKGEAIVTTPSVAVAFCHARTIGSVMLRWNQKKEGDWRYSYVPDPTLVRRYEIFLLHTHRKRDTIFLKIMKNFLISAFTLVIRISVYPEVVIMEVNAENR